MYLPFRHKYVQVTLWLWYQVARMAQTDIGLEPTLGEQEM